MAYFRWIFVVNHKTQGPSGLPDADARVDLQDDGSFFLGSRLSCLSGVNAAWPIFYAAGCSRIAARARSLVESAGVFAVPASFCNEGAMSFNFASASLLKCELSAF